RRTASPDPLTRATTATTLPGDPPSFPPRRSSDLAPHPPQDRRGRRRQPRRHLDAGRPSRGGRPRGPPPGGWWIVDGGWSGRPGIDRKSTRLNSSHVKISYAVSCLKKKKGQQARGA